MFYWKRLGVTAVIALSLVVAGCGSDDGETQAEGSVSDEMDYTITGLEPGAGQTELNEEVIATYENLDGWKQNVSSTGAMLTELGDAINNEEPIIITAWSPHYKFARWDLKFLEDPEGIYGQEEANTVIVRKGLKDELPEAYTILDRLHWEIADIEIALLDALDKDFDEIAENWVEENQETVTEWTEGLDKVDGTPIEIVATVWDEATFTATVAKVILEQQGYDVTLTPVDPAILFEAIATGDADASLSPWMPTTHGDLYAEYENEFEDLGPSFEGAKIGLAVPAYMDINSIEDLEPKE
ncbi:glycine betaine ABC transporter substrate-binding protein [Oceanobacillus sp. FSL H7-0719]|uniref:glycine betaine ABC transporter substrate-binding protein n=1 Tax=Oceanobacillus sp. FSL H7-0719 TaxID=2954507 RepID=UPI00324AFDF7